MNFMIRGMRNVRNWIRRGMLILLGRRTQASQVEKANSLYHVISLPTYELTDEQIKGSRAIRKLPNLKVEPGTSLTYGEVHHGA